MYNVISLRHLLQSGSFFIFSSILFYITIFTFIFLLLYYCFYISIFMFLLLYFYFYIPTYVLLFLCFSFQLFTKSIILLDAPLSILHASWFDLIDYKSELLPHQNVLTFFEQISNLLRDSQDVPQMNVVKYAV